MTSEYEIFQEMAERAGVDRAGGRVTRFHTNVSRQPRTTNAEHSFGVACLVIRLYEQFEILGPWWLPDNTPYPDEPLPSLETMLKAALHHDLPEQQTADLPAPFLARNPGVKLAIEHQEAELGVKYRWVLMHNLTSFEHQLVLFADRLECALDAAERWNAGDTAYRRVFEGCVTNLTAMRFAATDELVRAYLATLLNASLTSSLMMP